MSVSGEVAWDGGVGQHNTRTHILRGGQKKCMFLGRTLVIAFRHFYRSGATCTSRTPSIRYLLTLFNFHSFNYNRDGYCTTCCLHGNDHQYRGINKLERSYLFINLDSLVVATATTIH